MYKHFLKRVIDFIIALLGILLSSPIWLITIIAILINNFGPIFYCSTRIGKNNKEFKMEKYGEQWYQLMLDRKGLSRLQNKMIKNQQKSMGVRTFTR